MDIIKIDIDEKEVISLYQKGEGLNPLIEAVRETVDNFTHDLTTAKGRAATASLSAKVKKAKTMLDGLGKDLVSGWKQQAKVVDNARKDMREQLTQLSDEARAPLTAYENAEKRRLEELEESIQEIVTMGKPFDGATAEVYMEIHDKLSAITIDDRFQERKVEAFSEQQKSLGWLATEITRLNLAEAEKAELEKLRAEKEELDRAKKEEALKLEGEARAKKEADEKIQAEKDRLEAELKAKEEESKAKELEALRAKQDAEKKLAEAEARAQQAEANAVEKAEEAKAQELAEAKKREADVAHNKNIKTEVKLALVETGLSEKDAVKAVIAICDGKIPHTQIRF